MMTAPTLESPRFSLPADRLNKEMQWMETSTEVTPIVKITTAAVIWVLQVDTFRVQEADFLLDGSFDKTSDEHRYALSLLTANGEKIYLAAKQNGISKFLNDFTIQDVWAILESLRTTFICQYGEKNTPVINQAIMGLFDVQKS